MRIAGLILLVIITGIACSAAYGPITPLKYLAAILLINCGALAVKVAQSYRQEQQ